MVLSAAVAVGPSIRFIVKSMMMASYDCRKVKTEGNRQQRRVVEW
jgi:hypothetical protein